MNSGSTEAARILIVEDQDDVRRMLATALSIEGHQVDEASSAAEGLKCLQQSRYSLVLSDYAMPGGTGTWMLQQAAREARRAPSQRTKTPDRQVARTMNVTRVAPIPPKAIGLAAWLTR